MYLLSMDFCRGFVSFLRMNTVCDHLGIKAVSLQKSKVKQCEDTSECIKKHVCVCQCTCLRATPSKLALTKSS